MLQYTSLSLATGGLQFYGGRRGAEEAFPASSHSNKYFSAVQGFLSLLSLPTPAARKCSLQRSKLLSAHLDLQWSITLFALAKADKICKRKVMSFYHIQVQKAKGDRSARKSLISSSSCFLLYFKEEEVKIQIWSQCRMLVCESSRDYYGGHSVVRVTTATRWFFAFFAVGIKKCHFLVKCSEFINICLERTFQNCSS